MSRPTQYDHDELLQSLRASFLELGPGASTADLARRAGVSEGTLFKRFGNKKRLFAEAMRLPLPEDQPWFNELVGRAGTATLADNLAGLCQMFLDHMREVVPVMQMVFAHCGLDPRDLRSVLGEDEPMPLQVRRKVAEYFAAEIALGRIRPVDARMLANLFMGALIDRALRAQHGDVLLDETDALDHFIPTLLDTITRLTAPG
jgi:AcrR family transcriptional regulator